MASADLVVTSLRESSSRDDWLIHFLDRLQSSRSGFPGLIGVAYLSGSRITWLIKSVMSFITLFFAGGLGVGFVVFLVVEEEFAVDADVGPTEDPEDCAVHCGVEGGLRAWDFPASSS